MKLLVKNFPIRGMFCEDKGPVLMYLSNVVLISFLMSPSGAWYAIFCRRFLLGKFCRKFTYQKDCCYRKWLQLIEGPPLFCKKLSNRLSTILQRDNSLKCSSVQWILRGNYATRICLEAEIICYADRKQHVKHFAWGKVTEICSFFLNGTNWRRRRISNKKVIENDMFFYTSWKPFVNLNLFWVSSKACRFINNKTILVL